MSATGYSTPGLQVGDLHDTGGGICPKIIKRFYDLHGQNKLFHSRLDMMSTVVSFFSCTAKLHLTPGHWGPSYKNKLEIVFVYADEN